MLRVGVVGCGGMGTVHAKQYRAMGDVDLFFHDRDSGRSTNFADRWQATPIASFDALIQASDVVDICLPTDLHLEVGLKAIAAGRAVFVEKPITRTLEQARALRDAAAKASIPLMPGQVVRYFPEFVNGNRLVKSGAIGTPAAARTRRGGKAPTGDQAWFMDHARSGGVLVDLAIHDFDWLRWTLGEVKFLYSRSVAADKGTGPDHALTTLTFESGAVAHVESTWMDPNGFSTAFEVAGSEGLIQFDSRSNIALKGTSNNGSSSETPAAPTDDPYYKELSAFLRSVREGSEVPVSAEDGVRALSISLAAVESAKSRKVVFPEKG